MKNLGQVKNNKDIVTKQYTDDGLNKKANAEHIHDKANESMDGFMSAEDKKKLSTIEKGATKVIVDDDFDANSRNALQNKKITNKFEQIDSILDTLTGGDSSYRAPLVPINGVIDLNDTIEDQIINGSLAPTSEIQSKLIRKYYYDNTFAGVNHGFNNLPLEIINGGISIINYNFILDNELIANGGEKSDIDTGNHYIIRQTLVFDYNGIPRVFERTFKKKYSSKNGEWNDWTECGIKVKQETIDRYNNYNYRILLSNSDTDDTEIATVKKYNGVCYNPYEGYFKAPAFEASAGFYGNGANITGISADNISSGTLNSNRLKDSGVTSGSYGPSGSNLGSGNTLKVPYITVDSKGRITSAVTQTITLSDNLLVKQYPENSNNKDYRLLFSNDATDYVENGITRKSSGLTYNPSTKTLTTGNISGNLELKYSQSGTYYPVLTQLSEEQVNSTSSIMSPTYRSNNFKFDMMNGILHCNKIECGTAGSTISITGNINANNIITGVLDPDRLSTAGIQAYGDDFGKNNITALGSIGKFDVPVISVDSKGRVTNIYSQKLTLPDISNIGKVGQNNSSTTDDADYRVLLSYTDDDKNEIEQTRKSSGLTYNPSTKTLTAENITSSGKLRVTNISCDSNISAANINTALIESTVGISGPGSNITNINASHISSGTLNSNRLKDSGVTSGSYGPSGSNLGSGNTLKVPYITVDSKGRITSAVTQTITIPSSGGGSDNIYNLVVAKSSTTTSTTTSALSNGQVNLNMVENGSVKSSFNISGQGKTFVTSDSSGNIIIKTDISSSVGSVSKPVYFSNGDPKECNYSLGSVTQTVTTSNANYPLLLAPAGQSTSGTASSVYFDSGITLNPATNTIQADIIGSSTSCSGNSITATMLNTRFVGSDTASSNGYYKFASYDVPVSDNYNLTFLLTNEYDGNYVGLLQVWTRRETGTSTANNPTIKWLVRSGFPSNAVVASVSGSTVTLYVNLTVARWGRIGITLLSSSNRTGTNIPSFYSSSSPTASSDITIKSTSSDILSYMIVNSANTISSTQSLIYSATLASGSTSISSATVTGLFTKYKLILLSVRGSKGYHSHIIPLVYLKNNSSSTICYQGPSQFWVKYKDDNTISWFENQTSGSETYSSVNIYQIY